METSSSADQPAAVEQVTYLHIELDRHDIIFTNSRPAGSFLDDNCRG